MNIEKYRTVSGWYKAMKTEGYEIPLALYHTLNKIITENNVTFQVAYKELFDKGQITIVDKKINFNLNETKADK